MAFADGDEDLASSRSSARSASATPAPRSASGPTRSSSTRPSSACRKLKHVLRAKAVLCPEAAHPLRPRGATRRTTRSGTTRTASPTTCSTSSTAAELVPDDALHRPLQGARTRRSTGRWSGSPRRTRTIVGESYVNLIPTAQGGTHVNGFRAGLTDAIREFCEFRDLLPRGVKLAPEDVWARCCYVLSRAHEGPAVHRPDQGAALLARGRGLRLRRRPRTPSPSGSTSTPRTPSGSPAWPSTAPWRACAPARRSSGRR